MAKKKLPRLLIFDEYYQKRESTGPHKCCVCKCETSLQKIKWDVTFIELNDDKKIYVCKNCACKISDIYSETRPLKKIIVYILIVFGAAVILKACEDIFF